MNAILHQITSGIAGWLTFQQMQVGVDNLSEASLAQPLEEIARGRGFEVKGQFQLPKPVPRRGTNSTIDFLLVHRQRKIVIALEIKYKKHGKRMAGSLSADAEKLRDLSIETVNEQIEAGLGGPIKNSVEGFKLVKACFIVWHTADIMEQIKLEKAPIKKQFVELFAALLPEGMENSSQNCSRAMLGAIATRQVAKSFGSLRAGSTVTHKRFWVASFVRRISWNKL